MSDSPTRDHNVKARQNVIRSVCAELRTLEAERKVISDQIAAVKQKKIKGDLGMKIANFNVIRRVYMLEGDARNEFFDDLRENFEALGVGDQLNFLTVAEKANGGNDGKPKKSAGGTMAFGKQAGLEGKSASDNPWDEHDASHEHWHTGWLEGQAQRAKDMKKAPAKKPGRRKGVGGSAPA